MIIDSVRTGHGECKNGKQAVSVVKCHELLLYYCVRVQES